MATLCSSTWAFVFTRPSSTGSWVLQCKRLGNSPSSGIPLTVSRVTTGITTHRLDKLTTTRGLQNHGYHFGFMRWSSKHFGTQPGLFVVYSRCQKRCSVNLRILWFQNLENIMIGKRIKKDHMITHNDIMENDIHIKFSTPRLYRK
jgi:hypothetical protein